MKDSLLNIVTRRQAALIDALDRQDVAAIERETSALGELLQPLANIQPSPGNDADASAIDHAIRQNRAASMRVNYLSDWTRQRIDRLSQLRSGGMPSMI